jgi:hypothetical protein
MGKTFQYRSADGASSSVPTLVSLSRSSYDDLLDEDDDEDGSCDVGYNTTNVASKEASVAALPSSNPPSLSDKIQSDDGKIEIDDSYAEFLSFLGMSAYDIVQHNSGIKSIVQHPIYLPNDSYEDFLSYFGIVDPLLDPSGYNYEIQEKSMFRFAITTSDKSSSFDSISLDYMSAMCDMDDWSTTGSSGGGGAVVASSPDGLSMELSSEERMAILKEVEAHLELLKEFVGVVPEDELADRKKALYAVLPIIPPDASDPKKKRSRLAIATTASATSVGEGQLVQYVLIVLVVRYLVWGDNK